MTICHTILFADSIEFKSGSRISFPDAVYWAIASLLGKPIAELAADFLNVFISKSKWLSKDKRYVTHLEVG